MNKLSLVIEEAIQEALITGKRTIKLNNNITIEAEWEEWEQNSNYDVIAIYIIENGIIKFTYQIEDTKIEA